MRNNEELAHTSVMALLLPRLLFPLLAPCRQNRGSEGGELVCQKCEVIRLFPQPDLVLICDIVLNSFRCEKYAQNI